MEKESKELRKSKGDKMKQEEMRGQGWEMERDCEVGKMMGQGM